MVKSSSILTWSSRKLDELKSTIASMALLVLFVLDVPFKSRCNASNECSNRSASAYLLQPIEYATTPTHLHHTPLATLHLEQVQKPEQQEECQGRKSLAMVAAVKGLQRHHSAGADTRGLAA